MFSAPWVCRQCARTALIRRPARPSLQAWPQRQTSAMLTNHLPRRRPFSDIPAVLLERARRMSAEHAEIKKALETEFDVKQAKRAGEIQDVAKALSEWEEAQAAADELRTMAAAKDEDAELRQLARDELKATQDTLAELGQKLSVALTPKHPFGHMPCLIEFRPGPGGLEGRFFTDAMVRMYQNYCTRHNHKVRVVKYEVSDTGETGPLGELPLQEAVLEITDDGAYDRFRGEAGIHRVQRVPATESKGRTHTSAAAVWVLPSFSDAADPTDTDDPDSLFYINPADVRTETMRARGAGGQHVNKTESAIRLTHIPSNTVVSMQDSRSQHQNRDAAWKILRARIAERRREEREAEARRLRDSVLSKSQVTRTDKIRTYNYSQDRVTDHRCGLDVHNLPDVMSGGDSLDRIFEAVWSWQSERDVEAVLADETAAADKTKK